MPPPIIAIADVGVGLLPAERRLVSEDLNLFGARMHDLGCWRSPFALPPGEGKGICSRHRCVRSTHLSSATS